MSALVVIGALRINAKLTKILFWIFPCIWSGPMVKGVPWLSSWSGSHTLKNDSYTNHPPHFWLWNKQDISINRLHKELHLRTMNTHTLDNDSYTNHPPHFWFWSKQYIICSGLSVPKLRAIMVHFWLTPITIEDIFCLAFYFKWKYFFLIDHILSETICLFCFCVCSHVFTLKLNLRQEIGLTYAISTVKEFSGIFV